MDENKEKLDKKFDDIFKIISKTNDRITLNAEMIMKLGKLIDKAEKMPDFSDRRKPNETLH